jgi:hypothetical protein
MKMPSSAASASCVAREALDVPIDWEAVVILIRPFRPPPEGIRENIRRRQVSWLADLSPSPPSRSEMLQWPFGEGYRLQLRGQPRRWALARTAFPLGPSGTVDVADYRRETAARQTINRQLETKPVALWLPGGRATSHRFRQIAPDEEAADRREHSQRREHRAEAEEGEHDGIGERRQQFGEVEIGAIDRRHLRPLESSH